METAAQRAVRESLDRCVENPVFLDRFYEVFLASSPKVREKFAHTNFTRQKVALQWSLRGMVSLTMGADAEMEAHLGEVAEEHSREKLGIGAELYDLWLDSLLQTVKECDPQCDEELLASWESVMQVGIRYFLARY
jgi:hemoglobin-like flavoprotein